MSFLKKLFGGGNASGASPEPKVAAEEFYKGFTIQATPMKEGGQYRLAATISKEIGGDTKSHKLVRADLFQSADEAARFALTKAQQVIDEQGDALLGD
ncbi:HlyU family transcriptional regulator [Aurantimonas sp. VKM B-3413]|uniref:HlyU family transcriptional regulator n=1 Tax=Aurantimonas sp. VKM B-3413 TaxID=2779401 RepID=UPI001E446D2B|nr:HlyU family transcriptional regulator [Aurantimonas sp. VKM B-3413]MCB8838616.1 hypothetical protein [Aurantimonas sp. VKM B-3413]